MTMKQVDEAPGAPAPPPMDLANLASADLHKALKFSAAADSELNAVSALRAASEPWKSRGESLDESLQALTKLRPFIQVAKLQNDIVGYVTIERDGPVPGAAYMRNIVVKSELRRRGVGMALLDHCLGVARDMYRKTLALRVDPANAPAVSFY
ncbi:MAG TPA: GNAT family N-acetyltransferase, partial [Myxococcales bacterium]|nr:GNAT family N-acetyltransferase [Myxococcales bacterium]